MLLVVLARIFIIKPLAQLCEAAEKIAQGKIAVNLSSKKGGKFGRVFGSLQQIANNLEILNENFSNGEAAIKRGIVSHRLKDPRLRGAYGSLLDKTNSIIYEFVGFMNLFSEPVAITDEKLNVVFANNTIKRFTEKENQDVSGLHVDELLNDALSGHPAIKQALNDGGAQLEQWVELQLNQKKDSIWS